jgi:hypothetical protein
MALETAANSITLDGLNSTFSILSENDSVLLDMDYPQPHATMLKQIFLVVLTRINLDVSLQGYPHPVHHRSNPPHPSHPYPACPYRLA